MFAREGVRRPSAVVVAVIAGWSSMATVWIVPETGRLSDGGMVSVALRKRAGVDGKAVENGACVVAAVVDSLDVDDMSSFVLSLVRMLLDSSVSGPAVLAASAAPPPSPSA